MLGNLINRHDAVRFYRRLRRGQVAHLVGKVRTPGSVTGVRVQRATRQAKEAGLDDALSFRVADARQALREAEGRCDVVLALNALHHFGHLEETMQQQADGGRERAAPRAARDHPQLPG